MALKTDDTGMDKTAKIKLGVAGSALLVAVSVLAMYFLEFGLFSPPAPPPPPTPITPEVIAERQKVQQEVKKQQEEQQKKPGTVINGS